MKRYAVLLLVIASLAAGFAACSKNSNPAQPEATATPADTATVTMTATQVSTSTQTATATATASVTPTFTATSTPDVLIFASMEHISGGTTLYYISVKSSMVNYEYATVTVKDLTSATDYSVPYYGPFTRYQLDSTGGAAYTTGHAYRVEVSVDGNLYAAQGTAPGSVSTTGYVAGAGITATYTDGNHDSCSIYGSVSPYTNIFSAAEPGNTIDSPYNVPDASLASGSYYFDFYASNYYFNPFAGANSGSYLNIYEENNAIFTKP